MGMQPPANSDQPSYRRESMDGEEEFFLNDKKSITPSNSTNSLAFLPDDSTSNTSFVNYKSSHSKQQEETEQLLNTEVQSSWFWRAFNLGNLFSMSCLPTSAYSNTTTYQFQKPIVTRSPYDHWNGSFPFVITVLGPPKVGKTMICRTLKSCLIDIGHRNIFKFSPMPPDIQVSMKEDEKEGEQVTKRIDLGVYDTMGFSDADLIHYILEGQVVEEHNSNEKFDAAEEPRIIAAGNLPGSARKGKKKRINSEGFVVTFDVSNLQSFEMATSFIAHILDYFNFDPMKDSEARSPVVLFLVANKIDLYADPAQRVVTEMHVRALMQSALGAHISYHEVSGFKGTNITQVFKEMSNKIQQQREYYYRTRVIPTQNSFWD